MLVYLLTHLPAEIDRRRAVDTWPVAVGAAATLGEAPFWPQVEQIVVSAEPKSYGSVAAVVAARRLPVWVDCRFDELRRGGWVADYAAQVARALAAPDQSIGGWEPAAAALARVLRGIDALIQRFAPQTVALVGHGITLSLLRAHYLGHARVRPEEWSRLGFGAVAAVELPAGRLVQDFALAEAVVRA
jgi:broad specificity phosphatase PhoE